MKVNTFEYPKSALLGMPKDAALIMQKITSNQDILKLLYYGVKDWKSKPTIDQVKLAEMFETNQISAVPKIKIDKPEKTYLRLTYGTMIPNATNPQYRDNTFGIDIISHYQNWDLGNYDLRPWKIAGEIDAMLDGARLTGIGQLQFISASPYIYDEEFAGVSLTYLAIRGNEDEHWPLAS